MGKASTLGERGGTAMKLRRNLGSGWERKKNSLAWEDGSKGSKGKQVPLLPE